MGGDVNNALNPARIIEIREQFRSKSISAQPAHCLNDRYKDAGCTRCVDACPTGAIQLSPRTPVLDADQCVNCGLCLNVCPTSVFTQFQPMEGTLLKTVAQLPNPVITLTCPLHPDPRRTRTPADMAVQHRRCLAALTADQLLGMTARGKRTLWLDDSPCADCPLGETHAVLLETVAAANALLQAFGAEPAVHTLTDAEEKEDAGLRGASVLVTLVDGAQPRLSRRGLFGVFKQAAKDAAQAVEEKAPPPPSADLPVDKRLPHRVPPARRRLNQQLHHLASAPDLASVEDESERMVPTWPIPFAQVLVDEDVCSACGLCSRFCPTDALPFEHDDAAFRLRFIPELCIDCGICAKICPDDAIRFGDDLPTSALTDSHGWMVAEGALASCAVCGTATADHPDETGVVLCYACRSSASPTSDADRSASLMADALRRLARDE